MQRVKIVSLRCGLGVLLALVAVAVRIPSLGQPLLEAYSFRQTQTAYTALIFHHSGINLLHPQLPVFASGQVPFEFPLFQAIASLPMDLGVAPDVALRATCLVFFLIGAFLLWRLVTRIADRSVAMVTTAVFLFSPFSLLYSRTSLVEYLATAGGLAFVVAGIRWRQERQWRFAMLALSALTIALLVKPTIAVYAVLPFLYPQEGSKRGPVRMFWDPLLFIVAGLGFGIAILWNLHTDAIKGASTWTQWLTTGHLGGWLYGTIGQRLDLSNWAMIFRRVGELITGLPWLLVIVLALAVLYWGKVRNRPIWVGILVAPIFAIAIFFNLYVIHDYYLIEISPLISAAVGLSIVVTWRWMRRLSVPPLRMRVAILTAGLYAVWGALLVVQGWSYWTVIYKPLSGDGNLVLANELRQGTVAGEKIIVDGLDWDPTVPYYAQRSVNMLYGAETPTKWLDALVESGYDAVFSVNPSIGTLLPRTRYLLRRQTWIGSISTHLYITGDTRDSVSRAGVLATNDVASWPTENTPIGNAGKIPCDGRHDLAIHAAGGDTWVQLSASAADATLFLPSLDRVLPALSVMVIHSERGNSAVPLVCHGGGSLAVLKIAGA